MRSRVRSIWYQSSNRMRRRSCRLYRPSPHSSSRCEGSQSSAFFTSILPEWGRQPEGGTRRVHPWHAICRQSSSGEERAFAPPVKLPLRKWIDARAPRKPKDEPGTRRRAAVTSPASAVPMAPVALWPERIKSLPRIARTCPPSRRALCAAQRGRSRRQAIVVLYSAKHGQRDQFAASWRCDQLRVRLRYRMQRL